MSTQQEENPKGRVEAVISSLVPEKTEEKENPETSSSVAILYSLCRERRYCRQAAVLHRSSRQFGWRTVERSGKRVVVGSQRLCALLEVGSSGSAHSIDPNASGP